MLKAAAGELLAKHGGVAFIASHAIAGGQAVAKRNDDWTRRLRILRTLRLGRTRRYLGRSLGTTAQQARNCNQTQGSVHLNVILAFSA